MKKILLVFMAVVLLAAACESVELKREVPSYPKESDQPVPR